MNKKKAFANLLFWLTLSSPMVSFALASTIGEAHIFGVAGIVRYSWVMWLFIPIGFLSLFIGLKFRINNRKYRQKLIATFVCLLLLVIFGSYRFVFDIVSYDARKVSVIENQIKLDLPNDIKIATNKLGKYEISYIKIISCENKEVFEQEIKTNQLWQEELNSEIKGLLPLDIQYETEIFDYFVFYNIANEEYNKYPVNGEYESIFIAYDCDMQRLIILEINLTELGRY